MGVPNGLVIFLCIIGAGFVVLMGFAIMRHFQDQDGNDRDMTLGLAETGTFNQDAYMRNVRMRTQDEIIRANRLGGGYRG